jgi:uncharacterized lipoprotein YbaY
MGGRSGRHVAQQQNRKTSRKSRSAWQWAAHATARPFPEYDAGLRIVPGQESFMLRYVLIAAFLGALLVTPACNSTLPAATKVTYGNGVKVSGVVTYRERVALPDDAIIEVRLVDITKSDAPVVVVRQTIAKPGQVPVPFVLVAPANKIDQNHNYAVQASITVAGKERWHSTQQYGVITRGNPTTGLMLWVEQII